MISLVNKIFGAAGRKEKALKNQHLKTQKFGFRSLQQATNNFDEKRVIGSGGFGNVYMGDLQGVGKVAVKRKNPNSLQGEKEFQVEIELLAGLNHRNLVSLIGCCDENNEMVLVYEYMEKGTLRSHLYGSDKPSLSWKQRLKICVGAATGLHYLHTRSGKTIIHRDIKSANILLDEQLRAKVGDFGLSKTGPEVDQTHVITQVKGSFGYFDPEYFKTQLLTKKSDVYSFGVVLLEVLCGRPVIDHELPREKMNLVEWGMGMLKIGQLKEIVDHKISGTIKPRSLMIFGKIVERCLEEKSAERSSMEDVLRRLKYILSLEDKNPIKRSVGKIYRRTSNALDDLPGPSTCRVSPVLDESINADGNSEDSDHDVSPGNSDESDHDVSPGNSDESDHEVSRGNSDESDHDVTPGNSDESDHDISPGNSNEPLHDISVQPIKPGEGKALTRCAGNVYWRTSDVPDDLHCRSMSSQVSPILDESIISVPGKSDECYHDGSAGNSDDESNNGVSSQLITPGERKALTRNLCFRKDDV